ncbi:MAG: recombinase family protein [Phycisphaerales bacterium]
MTNAFAYLRGTGRGRLGGAGTPRQAEAIYRHAHVKSIDIVGEYRDEARNGTSDLRDRPGLLEMIEDAALSHIRLVFVERPERLADDLIAREIIIAELKGHGVRVVAVEPDVDLTATDDDPRRILIRQVLEARAGLNKDILTLNLRLARRRKRRRFGRCEGCKPFGHYPGERETLTRILELSRKPHRRPKLTFQAIADVLNVERRPTRFGKQWTRGTVRRVILRHAPRRSRALS